MIVIAKRGAAGLANENTLAALKRGAESGADILHIDVRLTKDSVPVLVHDTTLKRTHGIDVNVSQLTLAELHKKAGKQRLPTLASVLDRYFGKILLLIELRGYGSAQAVVELLASYCDTSQEAWDNILISSYKISDLYTVRRRSTQANLALLHDNNPFTFVAYQRILKLTAVGFHRLHTNRLAQQIAYKSQIFTFVYTVNRPEAAAIMEQKGYDGIVTNYPNRLASNDTA